MKKVYAKEIDISSLCGFLNYVWWVKQKLLSEIIINIYRGNIQDNYRYYINNGERVKGFKEK